MCVIYIDFMFLKQILNAFTVVYHLKYYKVWRYILLTVILHGVDPFFFVLAVFDLTTCVYLKNKSRGRAS